jgi:excisionase family DNA binding protein
MNDGYLDIKDAAQFLAISPRSLRRIVHCGKITFYRIPGTRKLLFRIKDLHFYMKKGKCRCITELLPNAA